MSVHEYKPQHGFLLLDYEEPIVAALQRGSPELQSYSPEAQDWLRCQTTLNRLVTMLVNGDTAFSRKRPADWIYRFLYPRPEFWRGSCRLDSGGPYTKRLQNYLGGKRITVNGLYAALKQAEHFLLEPPKEVLTETRHYTVRESLSYTESHPVVDEMRKMLFPLSDDVSVYVHGSMATGDYTFFSDVDDLVIFHRSGWGSYERFRQVIRRLEMAARLFHRVDPLQHHGHWLFTDFDMVCLDQSTMPLVVLENAIVVAGRHEIKANIRNEPWGFGRVLWANVQNVRRDALSLVQGTLNLYSLENLIGGISLLPALVFQVHGTMLDKKMAILKSEQMFSDQALMVIRWATRAREATYSGYGEVRIMKYLSHLLPCRRSVLERIARDYLPSLRSDQVPFFTEEIVTAIFQLTNECARHLREVILV